MMPALFRAGAALGWGVGCGAAGAGEAASSLLLSHRGGGVTGREGDGAGWSCGSQGRVLEVEF